MKYWAGIGMGGGTALEHMILESDDKVCASFFTPTTLTTSKLIVLHTRTRCIIY
jgi:hypothetical protein